MIELDNLRLQAHTESVRKHFGPYLDESEYEHCRNKHMPKNLLTFCFTLRHSQYVLQQSVFGFIKVHEGYDRCNHRDIDETLIRRLIEI